MDSLIQVSGGSTRPISLLLINPNSTASMTGACLASIAEKLPPHCTVYGFTAPKPSPSAIEGHSDAVLSAAVCLQEIVPKARDYDGFLVACFSKHPLIDALREEVEGPVIGIMEASLYAARMLGGRFGIVSTGERSKTMHEDAVRSYGLEGFSVGCEPAYLGVLELENNPKQDVQYSLERAAKALVKNGVDCVALGCAGMTGLNLTHSYTAEELDHFRQKGETKLIEGQIMILDGVGLGVHFLIGLIREGLTTPKGGVYRSAAEGRKARGQDWI